MTLTARKADAHLYEYQSIYLDWDGPFGAWQVRWRWSSVAGLAHWSHFLRPMWDVIAR